MNRHKNSSSHQVNRRNRRLATFVLVGVGVGMAFAVDRGRASAQASPTTISQGPLVTSGQRTISVAGTGSVTAIPDRLTLAFGVATNSPRVSEALKANNTSAQALIASLKANGLEEKDIKTSELSINPQFDAAGREVKSYNVSNTVTVTVRKIDATGELIDAVAKVSGNAIRISGLSFAVSDPAPLLATARDLAVKDATKQAEQLAKSAGVKLGKVRYIRSGANVGPTPVYGSSADVATAKATPISEGTQEIIASVELVFDVSD